MKTMRWASAISEEPSAAAAIAEVVAAVRAGLDGAAAQVALLFVSPDLLADEPELPARIRGALGGPRLVGCTGAGVIGAGREVEHRSALSLTAGHLPGVEARAAHLESERPPAPLAALEAAAGFVVLAEPGSFDAASLNAALAASFPGVTVVGGLASGNRRALFCDDGCHRTGAVVLSFAGAVALDTVIAQGCRPIGEPMIVTRCDDHRILSLGGRPPGEVIRALHDSLPTRDKNLFRRSLFLGIEMKDQREYHQGDFLIRNILGLQPEDQALVVGGDLERYKVVQFHLRDAETSAADLRQRLERYRDEGRGEVAAGLLFSCLGRGEHLYGQPNHDSDMVRTIVGEAPLGGFFCNGEIGPVGGVTFVHGYTSALALFRQP